MEIISRTVFPDGTAKEGGSRSTGGAPQGLACENASEFSTHVKIQEQRAGQTDGRVLEAWFQRCSCTSTCHKYRMAHVCQSETLHDLTWHCIGLTASHTQTRARAGVAVELVSDSLSVTVGYNLALRCPRSLSDTAPTLGLYFQALSPTYCVVGIELLV